MSEAGRTPKEELYSFTAEMHVPHAEYVTKGAPEGGFISRVTIRLSKPGAVKAKGVTGPSAVGRSKKQAEQAAAAAFMAEHGHKSREQWSRAKAMARTPEPQQPRQQTRQQPRQQPRQNVRQGHGGRWNGRDAANWGT